MDEEEGKERKRVEGRREEKGLRHTPSAGPEGGIREPKE